MTLKVVVGHEEVKSIAQVLMRELLNAAYIVYTEEFGTVCGSLQRTIIQSDVCTHTHGP